MKRPALSLAWMSVLAVSVLAVGASSPFGGRGRRSPTAPPASRLARRAGQWLDPGRFAVTGREADRGAFKTPTLREIGLTAPYMHDGSIPTLEQVIDFYDRGGNPNPHLDPELRSLHLTAEEKQDLAELLRNLSGTVGQAR